MDVTQMYGTALPDDGAAVRFGVGVIVINDAGMVLLELRSDCSAWGLPGGRLEAGESIVEAGKREVHEETGLEVDITGLVGVYSQPEAGRIVRYPEAAESVQLVDVVLTAAISGGAMRTSQESLDLQFFPCDKLPEPIVPPAHKPLRDFRANLRGVIA